MGHTEKRIVLHHMLKMRHTIGFLVFLIVFHAGLSPLDLFGFGNPKPGEIFVQELNMRAGPGHHHPVIATLHQGAGVLVLSYEGAWVRVQYNDLTGFVMNQERYIRIDEPDAEIAPSKTQDDTTDTLYQKLEASEKRISSISEKEAAVIDDLDQADRALARTRQQVAVLNTELQAVETQIRTLEESYRNIETLTEIKEQYVADRLTALYKLSWLGKFHLLASSDSMFNFFLNKRGLEQVLSHDEAVMEQLTQDKAKMQALMHQLLAKKKEKQVTSAQLSSRIDTMKTEQAKRETVLAEIKSKKSLQLAVTESLKKSARNLDRTVASFRGGSEPLPAKPVTVTEKPFASLKGLLMMPVKGRIISFFGHYQDSKFNVTHFQSGIHIRADRGEPIRAVYSGRTLFSSWFKGFGNMIIIDHGDHYYTVYAHLEEQFKSKGDQVEAGEVIATVGDTGSLAGAGLHFEVRHHGKPMNPLGWIKKG